MSFLLKKPQELAAASPTIVTQNSLNSSDAVMDINKSNPEQYSEPPLVDSVFDNGNIPINATDFLRDGVIAQFPLAPKISQLIHTVSNLISALFCLLMIWWMLIISKLFSQTEQMQELTISH